MTDPEDGTLYKMIGLGQKKKNTRDERIGGGTGRKRRTDKGALSLNWVLMRPAKE